MRLSIDRSVDQLVALGVIVAEPAAAQSGQRRAAGGASSDVTAAGAARHAVAVALDTSALDSAIALIEQETRDAYGTVTSVGEVADVAAVRRMFHGFGVDPTRVRPASEALLRRVLRSEPFPRIHPVVDTGNLCSLEFLLPIGSYDADAVRGATTCRLGKADETIETIGGRTMDVDGLLILADETGPFGGPISDADRTKVSAATERTLTVLFVPRELPPRLVSAHTEAVAARLRDLAGLRIVETQTVV